MPGSDKQALALFQGFVICFAFKLRTKRAVVYGGRSFLLSGHGGLAKTQDMLPRRGPGPALAVEMMLRSSRARAMFFLMKDQETPLRSWRPLDPLQDLCLLHTVPHRSLAAFNTPALVLCRSFGPQRVHICPDTGCPATLPKGTSKRGVPPCSALSIGVHNKHLDAVCTRSLALPGASPATAETYSKHPSAPVAACRVSCRPATVPICLGTSTCIFLSLLPDVAWRRLPCSPTQTLAGDARCSPAQASPLVPWG